MFQPTEPLGFLMIIAFSLSLSLHCSAMCAPLACAALGKRASFHHRGIWLYNLGRLLSYMAAGAALGGLASSAGKLWSPLGQGISLVLGMALLLMGFWRLVPQLRPKHLPLSTRFSQRILGVLRHIPSSLRDFALGLVTVLLPCMTLTPALGIAAASQSAVYGFFFMTAFALGTIPIMLAATNVPLVIYRKVSPSLTRWFVGSFLLVAGIITLIRVFPH